MDPTPKLTTPFMTNRELFNHCFIFYIVLDPQEVKLVKKEHFNRWYGLSPYFAALSVSKLPLQVSLNVVFCSIVYTMVGIPFSTERFVAFCLVGNVVSLVAESMGLAIGSVFNITVSAQLSILKNMSLPVLRDINSLIFY